MLKPTQDKELFKDISQILLPVSGGLFNVSDTTIIILKAVERRGYHIGLPSDIEWALNSGDGTYRP